ncbi:putative mucin/carbohydrate-binding domain-containing protein [Pseudomonas sp. PLMAX]|uniref:putative mucin/carbohydrate-binding domain-containing protein n=1 Tax=Pseudomonas sp. PLMAX TaxID=2201998 RepID=UPI0038BE0765
MSKEKGARLSHLYKSLERPDWLINAGMDKGIHHDKYTVGAVVSAGAKVRFRQPRPASTIGINLQLLNDDQKTELHRNVTMEWSEVLCSHPSVLFLTTPFTDEAGQIVTVDIEIVGDWKVLPIYKKGVNPSGFLNFWDGQGTQYALFESDYTKILIPARDKAALRALHQASGLDSLGKYYDGMFEFFNHLVGISSESNVPDKNIPNRYFMKADKNGGGAAYYGRDWTAESTSSVEAFWLRPVPENFGSLHEVAHGYQGHFFNHSVIQMHEIFHNVLATLYQQKYMGEEFYTKGWLYENGEEKLYENARIAFNKGLNDVAGAGHLIQFFYMLLVKSMGESGVIEFYRRYRQISNSDNFVASDHPTMDLLSKVGIDIGNVDFSPAMQYVKALPLQRQVIENSYSNAFPVLSLYLLVKESSLKSVQTQLKLRSPLDLVSSKDLSVTGLRSSVSFTFTPDIYSKVLGKCILIRDVVGGARIVKVNHSTVLVDDIPVGVHAVQLPPAGDDWPKNNYVVVTEVASNFDCSYARRSASILADQTIVFNGFYGIFCRLTVQVSAGRLLVDVVGNEPHNLFPGKVYAQFVVKDSGGGVVFSLEMFGDKTELLSKSIPIAPGFSIEVYHREAVGLSVSNSKPSAVIDTDAEINFLVVTEQGLVNSKLATEAWKNLKQAVERCAATFEASPHLALHDDYPIKQDLQRAINTFDQPLRGELLRKYRTIGFTRPPITRYANGLEFRWTFKGNADRVVGYINVNRVSRKIDLVFYAVVPHESFSSVYLAVVVKSKEGELLYQRELRGDVVGQVSQVQLPFPPGSVVSVMHREPTRSPIINNGQFTFPVGCVQHATNTEVVGLGLASYWPVTTSDIDGAGNTVETP